MALKLGSGEYGHLVNSLSSSSLLMGHCERVHCPAEGPQTSTLVFVPKLISFIIKIWSKCTWFILVLHVLCWNCISKSKVFVCWWQEVCEFYTLQGFILVWQTLKYLKILKLWFPHYNFIATIWSKYVVCVCLCVLLSHNHACWLMHWKVYRGWVNTNNIFW